MVRTFLKVYMELSSYFLFLQEQIKDIIISDLSLLFYYFSNLEPATLGISTSAKALSCFPPIIGNLNIATTSHLASL